MIPTLTIDMTAMLAPFGWVGLAAAGVGFAAIVGAMLRERLRPVIQELAPAGEATPETPTDVAA